MKKNVLALTVLALGAAAAAHAQAAQAPAPAAPMAGGAAASTPSGPPTKVAIVQLQMAVIRTQEGQKAAGDMQTKYDGIRQQMSPQFEQVRQQGREQIRELLTPDQQPKFEDYLRRLDEDRKRRNQP